MEQQEIQTLRALMEYEAARTEPPESFPHLPDIPAGRYTDRYSALQGCQVGGESSRVARCAPLRTPSGREASEFPAVPSIIAPYVISLGLLAHAPQSVFVLALSV